MLDESEFLGPYGIRSLSQWHEDHPYIIARRRAATTGSAYLPAESDSGMFGGNSNWRGPIWFPVNAADRPGAAAVLPLLRRRLPGRVPDRLRPADELFEVAEEISDRLARIFLRDEHGRRPVYGGTHDVPGGPALARLISVLRVLPRRQRRRAGRQPSDRLDRGGGQADPAVRLPHPPGRASRRQHPSRHVGLPGRLIR